MENKKIIKQAGRGRGTWGSITKLTDQCLCTRPHTNIICNICGFYAWGRLRYFCPAHPQTVFLCDINQCPQCKSYEYMMSEL